MRVTLEKEVADWLAESEITSKYKEGDVTANLNDLTEAHLVIPTSLFVKAKHEAYMVMRKDTFARWSCSDEFTQFVNSLEPLPARYVIVVDIIQISFYIIQSIIQPSYLNSAVLLYWSTNLPF